MKGLHINIYRSDFKDSLSVFKGKKALTLIVPNSRTEFQVFEPTDDCPPVTVVVKEYVQGEPYMYLVPCDNDGKPFDGQFMFDGSFGYTSDSRFSRESQYPLPIHARKEF